MKAREALEKIQNSMKELRLELETCSDLSSAQCLIGGPQVLAVRDYKTSTRYEFTQTGVIKKALIFRSPMYCHV